MAAPLTFLSKETADTTYATIEQGNKAEGAVQRQSDTTQLVESDLAFDQGNSLRAMDTSTSLTRIVKRGIYATGSEFPGDRELERVPYTEAQILADQSLVNDIPTDKIIQTSDNHGLYYADETGWTPFEPTSVFSKDEFGNPTSLFKGYSNGRPEWEIPGWGHPFQGAELKDIPEVVTLANAATGKAADSEDVLQVIGAVAGSGLMDVFDYAKVDVYTPNPYTRYESVVTIKTPGEGFVAGEMVGFGGMSGFADEIDGDGGITFLDYEPIGSYDRTGTDIPVTGGSGTGATVDIVSTQISYVNPGARLLDFSALQKYVYDGVKWNSDGPAITPIENTRFDVFKWLDGTSGTGVPMTGLDGYTIYKNGAFNYFCDTAGLTAVDGDTIQPRASDGALEVAAQTFTIVERLVKIPSAIRITFKEFWQGGLNVINALVTFATRHEGFATSAQGALADTSLQPLAGGIFDVELEAPHSTALDEFISEMPLYLEGDVRINVTGESNADLIIPAFIGKGALIITAETPQTRIAGDVVDYASSVRFMGTADSYQKAKGAVTFGPNTEIGDLLVGKTPVGNNTFDSAIAVFGGTIGNISFIKTGSTVRVLNGATFSSVLENLGTLILEVSANAPTSGIPGFVIDHRSGHPTETYARR
ncbi:hypothetical protein FACS189479_04390 [Spirochaetia bacterium]|nr:hypothetical protein FACS189479_04390 [Spirochaetia bacterium]